MPPLEGGKSSHTIPSLREGKSGKEGKERILRRKSSKGASIRGLLHTKILRYRKLRLRSGVRGQEEGKRSQPAYFDLRDERHVAAQRKAGVRLDRAIEEESGRRSPSAQRSSNLLDCLDLRT